jgi:hypothetical protein
MRKIAVIFIVTIFHLSCGNRKWTSADREKVVADCIKEAKGTFLEAKAKSYCQCMQPILEARYPTVAEANNIKEADMQTPEMQKEVQKCLQ